MEADGEPIRFVDVLTMASAVASYLGASEVAPKHVLDALAVLEGSVTIVELGRPVSPLVPKPPGGTGVHERVREFARAWVTRSGNDPTCPLGPERLSLLRDELAGLMGDP
jgi:antitoxin (DNA-binding transcriptional repressor) of toxin-antitoxin stability system